MGVPCEYWGFLRIAMLGCANSPAAYKLIRSHSKACGRLLNQEGTIDHGFGAAAGLGARRAARSNANGQSAIDLRVVPKQPVFH